MKKRDIAEALIGFIGVVAGTAFVVGLVGMVVLFLDGQPWHLKGLVGGGSVLVVCVVVARLMDDE